MQLGMNEEPWVHRGVEEASDFKRLAGCHISSNFPTPGRIHHSCSSFQRQLLVAENLIEFPCNAQYLLSFYGSCY